MDTVTFNMQPAGLRDLITLYKLESTCFGQDAWPMLDLIGVLTMPGLVRQKATAGETMIGFIGGEVRPHDGVGWITTVGVLPEYRRLGVASALLDFCEDKMNMPWMRLCVRRSNLGAIHLYELRGYRQVTIWAKYYMSGEDALVMEKQHLKS
jgi:ribosomal protein S18 acetylase RimI-like enzyme